MSNLVFSRRAIQRLITGLNDVLTPAELKKTVDLLNKPDRRLAAMWEIVFLFVLSRMGTLRYELPLSRGRHPDFELMAAGVKVVGDITTISDAGRHDENRVAFLDEELRRLARRHHLNPNHFDLDVRGARIGPQDKVKVKLKLPGRDTLQEVINRKLIPFLKEAAKSPGQRASKELSTTEYDFTISYIPGEHYRGGRYPSYDVAASLTKNPIFGALRCKADQLRSAPDEVVRLIISCDGDCAPYRSAIPPRHYSAQAIAKEFLRQHRSIDLVLLATVHETGKTSAFGERTFKLHYDLVEKPRDLRHERLSEAAVSVVKSGLGQAISILPQPVRTPHIAAQLAREGGVGPDMMGGYQLTTDRIRVSARAVQRLLAGQITPAEFAAAHNWSGERSTPNPFLLALKRGEMIKAACIETAGDRDDDWLEFQFAWDAAVAGFRLDG